MLIVSEKHSVFNTVRQVLPEGEFIPVFASGSEAGITLISVENPDLLIVGLTAADAYQSESFHSLRKTSQERSLPLLVLYPATEHEDAPGYYGDAWITMPVRKNDLLSMLNTLLKWRQDHLQLKATERKFNEIVNSVEELIFILDASGKISQVNNHFTKLTGYEKETALGNSFGLFLVPEDASTLNINLTEALNGNTTKVFSGRMVKADSTITLLEISLTPVQEASGTVSGLLCTAKDVSMVSIARETANSASPEFEYDMARILDEIAKQFLSFRGPKYDFPSILSVAPSLYTKYKDRYGQMINMAVDEKLYGVDNRLQLYIKELVVEMGIMKCGPADILEFHTEVVTERLQSLNPDIRKLFVRESQLLLLKCIGYLAGFYRNYTV